MTVMYVAPMFHTNQVPIIKGWLKNGHKVVFVCQYKGKTEDHTDCTPIVLGYSVFFRFLNKIYKGLTRRRKKHTAYPEAFQDKCGFPPVFKASRLIRQSAPQVVILRERSIYSIFIYFLCKAKKIDCILYNQTPLWDSEPPRTDTAHKIVNRLTPSIRMTPVYGDERTGFLDKSAHYVPFVIEPHTAPAEREYFKDGQVHVLCVGKYEERKHQLMLLEILNAVKEKYPFHLTLVGEVSTPYHRTCYDKLQQYIDAKGLGRFVSCFTNRPPSDMPGFYLQADLFILPSTGEFASVSQLEAMSYSLPVIVSDTNGTACYVEHGKNGFLFKDNNPASLQEHLLLLLQTPSLIQDMGKSSYALVTGTYSFSRYAQNIQHLRDLLHR